MRTTDGRFHIAYENGTSMAFVARIDPEQGQRLIPYQLRMLQTVRPARLLPVGLEEVDGISRLRYDYTGLSRLMPMLRANPPGFDQFLELASLLVRTIAECSGWMLDERGFVLDEEFIFAGSGPADFKLCYIPAEGGASAPVQEQLRLLLLKMLGTVQTPIDRRFVPVFDLLGQETYSLQSLSAHLKRIWLEPPSAASEKAQEADYARRIRRYWSKLAGRIKRTSGLRTHAAESSGQRPEERKAAFDRTQLLTDAGYGGEIIIEIHRGGKEERFELKEDRFIIGRSESGVHYTDDSAGVSRIHCEIVRGEAGLTAADLGSLNGTRLNGERLVPYKPRPFKIGDVLAYAHTEIRLLSGRPLSQLGQPGSTGND